MSATARTKAKDVRAVLVEGARSEALADGSAAIEAEHLLLGLAGRERTTASRLLREAGLDREAIRAALDREWEQSLAAAGVRVDVAGRPTATPDPRRSVQIGASAKSVLKRAMDSAAATGGGRIGSTHILVGLLSGRQDRVARALDLAGVDRDRLIAAADEAAARADH